MNCGHATVRVVNELWHAAVEVVNESESGHSPPFQGGVATRLQRNGPVPTGAAGVVLIRRKPPRPLLGVAATPPWKGGECPRFQFHSTSTVVCPQFIPHPTVAYNKARLLFRQLDQVGQLTDATVTIRLESFLDGVEPALHVRIDEANENARRIEGQR